MSRSVRGRRRRRRSQGGGLTSNEEIGFGGKVMLELERPASRQDLHLFQVGKNASLFSHGPGHSTSERPGLSGGARFNVGIGNEYCVPAFLPAAQGGGEEGQEGHG